MNQWTVTTEDRRLDQIVALACAHVTANCNWREANRLAIAQHAHLLSLMAKEQPEAKPLGRVWEYKGRLYTDAGQLKRQAQKGEVFAHGGDKHDCYDWRSDEKTRIAYTILRELTTEEAEAYRKEQQQ
jgi:hypothetical protein